MPEQPLNLRFALRAISRQRLILGTVVAIGVLAGIGYGIERPPLPSASALVLLPSNNPSNQSASGAPTGSTNATQVIIATSTPVLTAAGQAVSPPIGPRTLKHFVTVTALSQDVLQVVVHYPKARDAIRLANAVASSYVYFVTKAPTPAVENQLAGLQQQANLLTSQIQGLQSQVNSASTRLSHESLSSPQGRQDATLIQSLRNKESQYSLELDNVTSQIATAQLSTGPSAVGTAVLQRAVSVAPSSTLHYVVGGSLGAAAGLIVGLLLVLIRSRRDHRLRFRDEISGATGAPVLGSLYAQTCKTSSAWAKLLQHYEPSAIERWAVRKVLSSLSIGRTGSPDLRVVAFADDGPAIAAGTQLAITAAKVGTPTALVPSNHPVLAPLRAASRIHGRSSPCLLLAAEATDPVPGRLMISLAPVERYEPRLPPSNSTNLIAVSSGSATAEDLARLALAAADAGDGIPGVILINPEPKDPTSGSFLERTMIRRPPMPAAATSMERCRPIEWIPSTEPQR